MFKSVSSLNLCSKTFAFATHGLRRHGVQITVTEATNYFAQVLECVTVLELGECDTWKTFLVATLSCRREECRLGQDKHQDARYRHPHQEAAGPYSGEAVANSRDLVSDGDCRCERS